VAISSLTALGYDQMDPLFLATVQAVEESIINAMIAAEPMTGYQGHKAAAIDHKALIKVLKEHKAIAH
jgi:D-aminopeptidase